MSREMSMRRVTAINNGTVIDHIPAGCAITVLKMLGVDGGRATPVTLAMNVPSAKMGLKDITWFHEIESVIFSRFRTSPVSQTPQMSQVDIRTVVL